MRVREKGEGLVLKVALVIAEKVFRDEEYQVPKKILLEKGIEVVTASTTTGWAEGKLGARVKPDLQINELKTEELDALVFVGGGGAAQYFDDPLAHQLARQMEEQGKVVAAICIAPVILARAGLLQGKKATVFPDGVSDLIRHGAEYTGKPVERDGLVLTSNGPEAAEAFGRTLVVMLIK